MFYDTKKPKEAQKARDRFDKLLLKESIIEIKEKRDKRTLNQNSYVHVLFGLFGIDTGYTIHEVKSIIKRELGFFYVKNGTQFLEETSKMDTKRKSIFIDKFRKFSSEQGIYLPTSEEYLINKYELHNKITVFEKYL